MSEENLKFKNDIPQLYPRRLNVEMRDVFEWDLKLLLNSLENLCNGRCDHIDYVKEYQNFVKKWGLNDKKP